MAEFANEFAPSVAAAGYTVKEDDGVFFVFDVVVEADMKAVRNSEIFVNQLIEHIYIYILTWCIRRIRDILRILRRNFWLWQILIRY